MPFAGIKAKLTSCPCYSSRSQFKAQPNCPIDRCSYHRNQGDIGQYFKIGYTLIKS